MARPQLFAFTDAIGSGIAKVGKGLFGPKLPHISARPVHTTVQRASTGIKVSGTTNLPPGKH